MSESKRSTSITTGSLGGCVFAFFGVVFGDDELFDLALFRGPKKDSRLACESSVRRLLFGDGVEEDVCLHMEVTEQVEESDVLDYHVLRTAGGKATNGICGAASFVHLHLHLNQLACRSKTSAYRSPAMNGTCLNTDPRSKVSTMPTPEAYG